MRRLPTSINPLLVLFFFIWRISYICYTLLIVSSFLRFWLVVASMYLLFLSVRSTFHTRFQLVCSSILYRTSIGHQSDNNRTTIEQKALLLPCIIGAIPWLHLAIYTPRQVTQDEEGMQTMRTLARNMAWMIRNLNVSENGHPELESPMRTNFIR